MDNTISSSVYQPQEFTTTATRNSISSKSDISSNHSPLQQQSDSVTLSPESLTRNTHKETGDNEKAKPVSTSASNTEISSEDLREIQKLQKRDAEVKAHEQAHLSSAGQYAAGGASFSYKTGPNGKKYAVGGEVPIDLSKENDPQATLAKMTQVRRAALAPANPSAADRNIAARASMLATEAMSEINSSANKKINNNEASENDGKNTPSGKNSSAIASGQNQPFPSTDDPISTHTRHMVLQAYAAQS